MEQAVPVFAATLPLALLQFVLLSSAPRARDVAIYREERTAHAEDCAASCDAELHRIIELQEKLATSLADCAFWRPAGARGWRVSAGAQVPDSRVPRGALLLLLLRPSRSRSND